VGRGVLGAELRQLPDGAGRGGPLLAAGRLLACRGWFEVAPAGVDLGCRGDLGVPAAPAPGEAEDAGGRTGELARRPSGREPGLLQRRGREAGHLQDGVGLLRVFATGRARPFLLLDRGEHPAEDGHAREATPGGLAQGLEHCAGEIGGQGLAALHEVQRQGLLVEHALERDDGRVPGQRRDARQHLVQQQAQPVHVGPGIGRLAPDLLRRQVLGRREETASLGEGPEGARRQEQALAVVGQQDEALPPTPLRQDEDVAGLQPAVEQPTAVDPVEGRGHLGSDGEGRIHGQAADLGQQPGQGGARLDEVQDRVRADPARTRTKVMDRQRMVRVGAGGQAGMAAEDCQPLAVRGQLGAVELQRVAGAEQRVLRAVHLPGWAFADEGGQQVAVLDRAAEQRVPGGGLLLQQLAAIERAETLGSLVLSFALRTDLQSCLRPGRFPSVLGHGTGRVPSNHPHQTLRGLEAVTGVCAASLRTGHPRL